MPSVRPRTPVQILERVGFPIKHRPSLINWFDFGKTLKRRSQTHFVAKNHLPKRKSRSGGDGIGYLHKNVTCLPSIFASIYFSCECDANLELCWWKTLSTAQQRDDWTAIKLLISDFIRVCLQCWRFSRFLRRLRKLLNQGSGGGGWSVAGRDWGGSSTSPRYADRKNNKLALNSKTNNGTLHELACLRLSPAAFMRSTMHSLLTVWFMNLFCNSSRPCF